MSDLIYEVQDNIALLTLNRIEKQNAFDNHLLHAMQQHLEKALEDEKVRVLLLKANGKHFCAGADLAWMQSMANFSEEENLQDSLILGKLMQSLYQSAKPTVAVIQGAAFGGGVGLAAACDLAIATPTSRFCFSEAKLGLIPAVISPYVIQAIGARQACALFMSAEIFSAPKALQLGLVHHVIEEEKLQAFAFNQAQQIANNAPLAVQACKKLVRDIAKKEINADLIAYTAQKIAEIRISEEGQHGLTAFLNKETPHWKSR